MAEQSAHEPTMEEILASIRRIISEDDVPEEAGETVEAAPASSPEPVALAPEPEPEHEVEIEDEPEEDVLELTQTYETPEPPKSVSIGDIEAYEPEPEPVAAAPEPAPVAAPVPMPKPAPVMETPKMDHLVSEHTSSTAASAFGSLTSALLVPKSGRTLEDVASDLLRPLLQSWLDQHLPAIVEEQVRLEVERIARQARR